MSTSLLYHAFGIREYKYVRTDYPDGQVIFNIRQESKTCRCPACGATRVQSRGHVERRGVPAAGQCGGRHQLQLRRPVPGERGP